MAQPVSDTSYIIAEVGGNHGGDFEMARKYLETAAQTGVDAVKFQLYQAENLIVRDEPPLPLAGEDYDSQFERFKELELTVEQWRELATLADEYDVDFAASVFDCEMADLASELAPFIKIASGDLTNIPLLRYVNTLGDDVILSTGFATMDEIEMGIKEIPNVDLTLLHCVGSYPTPDDAANLQMIDILADKFGKRIGYSDHTVGTRVPLAAVARGATVIKKYFTLNKSQAIGDHRLSATPEEMARIVEESERIASMFTGWGRESCLPVEESIRTSMRRSLAVNESFQAGDTLHRESLTTLRPASGIPPTRLDEVVGVKVRTDLQPGDILQDEHLQTETL